MNILGNLFSRWRPAPPPRPAVVRVVQAETSARPTYATALAGNALLPRRQSFLLLKQFYNAIPALGRTVDVLAGFVGQPQFVTGSEQADAELALWARSVGYGYTGQGLKPWIRDHLGQTLLYGYGIGEMVADARRTTVERLWSYESPAFGFRTDPTGALVCIQSLNVGGEKILNPDSIIHTAYNPHGCDPNGQSLFFASHTFCQAWVDIAHAFRSTWRRSGIPSFHIHTQLPAELDDPDGEISAEVNAAVEAAFNEAMRSAVVDGQAKDFFTANTGETKVNTIGVDGQLIDIEQSKRAIVEEIVTATGLPAWMFGYSWSTTERLSGVQADLLMATIDNLRSLATPGLERIVRTRQQLSGRRDGLAFELKWPDISLVELKDTAQAAVADSQAALNREKYATRLWQTGVWNQEQYAKYLTGSDEVDTPMDEPPGMQLAEPQNGAQDDQEGDNPDAAEERALAQAALKAAAWELRQEYAGVFPACNGRH